MDRFFGNAYRGDPGVPHSGEERFSNIWLGSLGYNVIILLNPYTWHFAPQFNWHDRAMLFEQYHWKQARKRGEPYEFKWNQLDREIRDSYYHNWREFFN